jgi:hypothetical protein
MEADALEADGAALDMDGCRILRIDDAQWLVLQGDQLLHLVDAALQVGDVEADVAQVAEHDEIGGQYRSTTARWRAPSPGCAATRARIPG